MTKKSRSRLTVDSKIVAAFLGDDLEKNTSEKNMISIKFKITAISRAYDFFYFPVCWARISGSVTENSRPRLPVVNKVVATFLGDDLEKIIL